MAIAKGSSLVYPNRKIPLPTPELINTSGVLAVSKLAVPTPERTALVDSSYVPLEKLKAHVEGAKWKVEAYYHQVLGTDDTPSPLDLNLPASHQTYNCIVNMVLMVTSTLTYSQATDTMTSEYIGEATLFHNLTPTLSDMFVAKIGDGRYGVFTIIEVPERLSISKQSAFTIKYAMVNYLDDETAAALLDKTISRLIYTPELEGILKSPFLTEEAHQAYITLGEHRFSIERYMALQLYDHNVSGCPVPNQSVLTFDPYHSLFCNALGISEGAYKPFSIYHCSTLDYDQVYTIWNLLADRLKGAFDVIVPKLVCIDTSTFDLMPHVMSLAYTGYGRVMYPHSDYFDIVTLDYMALTLDYEIRDPYVDTLSDAITTDFNKDIPMYHLTDKDDHYVLSEAFYTSIPLSMSILELTVAEMLANSPVSTQIIQELCTAWYTLDKIEQYYYGPILIVLISYVEGT